MVKAELYDQKTIRTNYAQSWSMIYFMMMYEPRKRYYPYRQVLQKYYMTLKKGKGAAAAYDVSFGKVNVFQMESEWKDFVLAIGSKRRR